MVRPVVSVVLGTYNRLPFLKDSIDTTRSELSGVGHEIIVIDGGSTDGTIQWLSRQKDIITIVQHNRGEWRGEKLVRRSWGYFMNLGFKISQGKYICMISDDCLVLPGAIKNGVKVFNKSLNNHKKVGAVAFYWRNWPEQEKYWVGLTLGGKMFVNHGLYLKSVLEEVGYADEETYSFYHADGDLSLKIWERGYEIIQSPKSFIEHYSDANAKVRTSNLTKQAEDLSNYLKRWRVLKKPTKDWVEKTYSDPSNTARRYWLMKVNLVNLLKTRIKRIVRNKKKRA